MGVRKDEPVNQVQVEVVDTKLGKGVIESLLYVLGRVEVVRELDRVGSLAGATRGMSRHVPSR